MMWLALAALERSPWRERIGWEVLLNPDEEIGSCGSAPLLAEAAQRNRFGLVFDPSFAAGNLAGARSGSGNCDIMIPGLASHAGRNPAQGRQADVPGARAVAELRDLQHDAVQITPRYKKGKK